MSLKDYIILVPDMLEPHFDVAAKILKDDGYNVVILRNDSEEVITAGLESVHNDMCYPALIVIGQFIDALRSGKFDNSKVALLISQTGGGCRASNYIYLLRKALKDSSFEYVPVVSFNPNSMDENSLVLRKITIIKIFLAIFYCDLIMYLFNKCVSYELNSGDSKEALRKSSEFVQSLTTSMKFFRMKKNYKTILKYFSDIKLSDEKKVKVGIVGEIYIKYSPIGNKKLNEYLVSQGAEVVNSGLIDFILSSLYDAIHDKDIYGTNSKSYKMSKIIAYIFEKLEEDMIKIVKNNSKFTPPISFKYIKDIAKDYIGYGVKMGEGWLLTAEMAAFVRNGIDNVISVQPFGCLPNQIIAKGMIRKIKELHGNANIIAIDYDPGSSKTNQENRIKLMLSSAKRNLNPKEG